MGQFLCSEAGSYDRVVIQELLKEIAQTQQVDLNAKQRFKGEDHFHATVVPRLHALNISGNYQRGRFFVTRCSSGPASNNGKIHVKHAHNPLCQ